MELEYRVQEEKMYNRWVLRVGISSNKTWVFEEWPREPTTDEIIGTVELFTRAVHIWKYYTPASSLRLVKACDDEKLVKKWSDHRI